MGLVYISTPLDITVADTAVATVDITGSDSSSALDATYKEYQFHFVNIHPATNNVDFGFQMDVRYRTGFDEPMTTTFFQSYRHEGNVGDGTNIYGVKDQAQGTAYQPLGQSIGNQDDQCLSGVLTIYDPSSDVYATHFVSRTNTSRYAGDGTGLTEDAYVSGFVNRTRDAKSISFKMSSGNIDAGTIHMYGVG